MANTENCPKVGIVMGSDSDMPVMAKAADILEAECGALWAGERTAAETATQIQKRMELYLAENAT